MATYNPTATFHTSSSIQTNGQVADATSLAQAGADALDNVAYLTGDRQNTGVRRIGSVSNLLALKNLDTPDMFAPEIRDEDFIFVESIRALFQYDYTSVATGDNYSVVTPNSGTGRYLRTNNLPASTTMAWTVAGSEFWAQVDPAHLPTYDMQNGTLSRNPNDTATFQAGISGPQDGDVLTSVTLLLETTGTPGDTDVEVLAFRPADPTTITTLGTATYADPVTSAQTITFGTPYTFQAGDRIVCNVDFGGGTGTWVLSWVTLNGTRNFITM